MFVGCFRVFIATAVFLYGVAAFPARSEEAGSYSGSVTLASQYVARGRSYTLGDPAIQASLTYTHNSGAYVGFWGSSANAAEKVYMELDLSAGYIGKVSDYITYDVGVTRFVFPSAPDSYGYDYTEFSAATWIDLGSFTPVFAVFYSPNSFGASDDSVYMRGGVRVPVIENVTLFGNAGLQMVEGAKHDVIDWNLGVLIKAFDLDFDFRYTDTNSEHRLGRIAKERFVASVTKTF